MEKEGTTVKASGGEALSHLVGVYLKLVGFFLIVFSLAYWSRLVGIANPEVDFASLEDHWRFTLSALVVLQPIAALGLWGGTKWGVIVWLLVIIIEFFMYFIFDDFFGSNSRLLIFHATTLILFLLSELLRKAGQRSVAKTSL